MGTIPLDCNTFFKSVTLRSITIRRKVLPRHHIDSEEKLSTCINLLCEIRLLAQIIRPTLSVTLFRHTQPSAITQVRMIKPPSMEFPFSSTWTREKVRACRGFTHVTIDKLKSKIATATMKTVSFNVMRHALPCGAACWQKSALFQLQDHALARK